MVTSKCVICVGKKKVEDVYAFMTSTPSEELEMH